MTRRTHLPSGLARFLLMLWFAASLVTSAPKEPDADWAQQKGITDGTLIKGSVSPDKKYALFEFFFWDGETRETAMTATGIGIAPADRSRLLYVIYGRTKWMTDKEVPSFLDFLWNPNSSLLATHDSMDKHSAVHIYRVKDGAAVKLEVPDLLALACKRLGIKQSQVTGSGQVPGKWLSEDMLETTVRLRVASKTSHLKLRLKVGADGAVTSE
jgi:hypothetical protein